MLDLAKLTGLKKTMKGGELLARMLHEEGVETVFGIIDGTYFGFYASLRKVGISLLTPRHETSAAHMAGAYARVTGKLGVCMASNGPGVANILPGVAVESAEGNRVLLITSARRVGTIDPDRGGTYQSFPQVEVTAQMCKWSCRVPSVDRLAEVMRRALRKSYSGRPGVVHVDVPESIMNGDFEGLESQVREPSSYRNTEPLAPTDAQIAAAADLLIAAKKPMIHAGSGVIHARAHAELTRVAELLHAPVTTSWGARGATSERHPIMIPLIHVSLYQRIRTESDCALLLGSRVGETDLWGKPPYWRAQSEQRAIQVDLDEETLGNNKRLDLAIVADVRVFLQKLADAIAARKGEIDVAARRSWLASIADDRAADRARLDKALLDRSAPLHPAHVAAACRRHFRDDAICVLDGGNTAIWGNFFHEIRSPGTLLGTPKFGMLGAGIAQALGAKAANKNRQVYCITGDGAMGFHPQEIETAVRNGLNVIYLVVSDKQWGMVKMNQSFQLRPVKTLIKGHLDEGENINADLGEIEWAKLAESMGAYGDRASDPDGLDAAIERAIASGRPAVIHVDVDPVKHMWAPALRHFKDMHAEPSGC